MVHVQTGNMLDVIVEGKSLGLLQRGKSEKHDVIWLPEPEGLAMVLLAELERLNPTAAAKGETPGNEARNQ